MSTVARFELTLGQAEKEFLSRAAAAAGTTMAAFVRAAAKEKAQELLDRESRITLSAQDFETFSQALNTAFTPNPALQKAMASAQKVKRA